MGAARPESGLHSKIPRCMKGYVIIVMGAARPVAGLRLERLKPGTARFWKRTFAELIGTWAGAHAHKKD